MWLEEDGWVYKATVACKRVFCWFQCSILFLLTRISPQNVHYQWELAWLGTNGWLNFTAFGMKGTLWWRSSCLSLEWKRNECILQTQFAGQCCVQLAFLQAGRPHFPLIVVLQRSYFWPKYSEWTSTANSSQVLSVSIHNPKFNIHLIMIASTGVLKL